MISQPIIIPLEPVLIYKDTDKSVTMSNFVGFITWPCAIVRNDAKKFSETLIVKNRGLFSLEHFAS